MLAGPPHNLVKTTHFMLWNVQTGAELLVKDPLPPKMAQCLQHRAPHAAMSVENFPMLCLLLW
jgi:hypothetical protein